MFYPSLKSPSPLPSPPPSFPYFPNPNPTWIHLYPKTRKSHTKSLSISLKSVHQIAPSISSINGNPNLSPLHAPNVAEKLPCLVSEFRSLPVPIDRVKRLLQYADILPPFEELGRVISNRVMGCTAQVWLEVKMDEEGKMRFRVDSDSEITKGFCSCLIWLLDGAAPGEVLEVKKEDLVEINVGLPANSRVNTWHNVLISMQKRTKDLVEERYLESFPCLVASCDDRNGRGTYSQAQLRYFSASMAS
ncbi:hypothetical protein LguiA_032798 [Lonicera macranthoides]